MSDPKSILDTLSTCLDSYEVLNAALPSLLPLTHQNESLRALILDHLTKVISSKSSPPQQKFYALYFVLKAVEDKSEAFILELAKTDELITFIFHSAQTDPHKSDAGIFERGMNFYSHNPTRSQAKAGINFVRLCVELIFYLNAEYGMADANDSYKFLATNLQKKVRIPSSYWFVGHDYIIPKKRELYDWNFNKSSPVDTNQVLTIPSVVSKLSTMKFKDEVEDAGNEPEAEEQDDMILGSQSNSRFTTLGMMCKKEGLRQSVLSPCKEEADVGTGKCKVIHSLQPSLSIRGIKKVLGEPSINVIKPEGDVVKPQKKLALDNERIMQRKNRLLNVLKTEPALSQSLSPISKEKPMTPFSNPKAVSQSNSSKKTSNFEEELLRIQENISMSMSKKLNPSVVKIDGMAKVPSYAGSSPTLSGTTGLTPVSATDYVKDKVKSLTSLDDEDELSKWKRKVIEKRQSAKLDTLHTEEDEDKRRTTKFRSVVNSSEKENKGFNFGNIEIGKGFLSPHAVYNQGASKLTEPVGAYSRTFNGVNKYK